MIIELQDVLNTMIDSNNINIIHSQRYKKEGNNYTLFLEYHLNESEQVNNLTLGYEGDEKACKEDQKKIFANIK